MVLVAKISTIYLLPTKLSQIDYNYSLGYNIQVMSIPVRIFWSVRIKGRAFSLKPAAVLAMERLLVGLHCQEKVDNLFLEE